MPAPHPSSLLVLTDQHAKVTSQEQLPPTDLLNEHRRGDSHAKVEDLQDTVDEGLGACGLDADGLEDDVDVVRDEAVAGPLREHAETDDDAHAAPVAGGAEECPPGDFAEFAFERDGFADFAVLVLRVPIVRVCFR